MQNSQLLENKPYIPTPAYVIYEEKLVKNLRKLKDVEKQCGIKIIMAFKANSLWKTFPIIARYFTSSTASSLNEMQLSLDFLGNDVHAYCPVYTEKTFPKFLEGCSHITFNSLSQFNKFFPQIKSWNTSQPEKVSPGLRVNPKCSVIEHDIYNPAVAGSRFGVSADTMPDKLPEGLEGLHFHALCECGPHELDKVLTEFEKKFGKFLPEIRWVNFGGGHLITREDYDVDFLYEIISEFKKKYPWLDVILEPGSAFTWQTGDLVTTVLDVVEDEEIKTAIIDASFACHMPDCLEMPYKPIIAEAIVNDKILKKDKEIHRYRLGGNSCLSGDFVGDWYFTKPLYPGQRLTLLDMNHYTTVKTNMFNGIQHPSIWLIPINGDPIKLKEFGYEDYRDRMD